MTQKRQSVALLPRWVVSAAEALYSGRFPKIMGLVVSAAGTIIIAWLPLLVFYHSLFIQDEDRINRAWTLISSASKGENNGNLGLIDALQALHQHKTNLSAIRLQRAYLANIQLPEAKLGGVSFAEATLDHAKLQRADLTHADLTGAIINFANLEGAELAGADIHRASLRGAKLSGSNLQGAKLVEADLSGADLRNADLRGADLTDAVLFRANLRGNATRLDLADLTGSDLSVADLREAHLDGARLKDTILHGADLTMASFHGTIFQHTDVRRALLLGVDLRDLSTNSATKYLRLQDKADFENSCVDERTQLPDVVPGVFDGNSVWCGPPSVPETIINPDAIVGSLLVNLSSLALTSPPTRCGTIYYLIPTRIDEFQTESQKMIEVVFSKMGCKVVSIDAEEDASLQVTQFVAAARKHPEAIIVNPVDFAKIAPAIDQFRDTLTLVYDRAVRDVRVAFSVTANGYQTGTLAAKEAVQLLETKYESKHVTILEIVGDPADSHSTEFQKGFESVIEDAKSGGADIELISRPAMKWDPTNALKIFKEFEQRHIDIIVAHAAHLLRPIVAFLKSKDERDGTDNLKRIWIMSTNGAPVGLRNIKQGIERFEFEQPMYAEVYSLAKFFYETKHGSTIKNGKCELPPLGAVGHLDNAKGGLVLTFEGRVIEKQDVDDKTLWGNIARPELPIDKVSCPPPK
jgi:ribose transport system substrate-binding protein